MTKYNKFWLSLIGPIATGLTVFTGLDADAAQTLTATAASLIGSVFVAIGPANKE